MADGEYGTNLRGESVSQGIRRRRQALLEERQESFDPMYRDLADYIAPRRGKWCLDTKQAQSKSGKKSASAKIINNTATTAARTLAAGLMSGATSPSRPWFHMTTSDPDLVEQADVKDWLYQCETRMREALSKSNLYHVLVSSYMELGVFGTMAMVMQEDDNDIFRFVPCTVGSYVVSQNARLVVDSLIYDLQMTVQQLVEQFGMDNVSERVKCLWREDHKQTWIDVTLEISPNPDHDPTKLGKKVKAYRSTYIETNCQDPDKDKTLSEKGYYEAPVLCSRWDVTGNDTYGTSPGMDALGDIKMLQFHEKTKLKVIDKIADPPMVASADMRNQKSSIIAGDVTYVNPQQAGGVGFVPAFQINPQAVGLIQQSNADVEQRIRTTFYADLFLMLANDERSGTTAREIAERHEEKLLALGPVVERLNKEFLDPLIDRAWAMMVRAGAFPRAPESLQGQDIKVEYISVLAQAQRAVGTTSLQTFLAFTGGVLQASAGAAQSPVGDKVDFDALLDEFADAVGVPPRVVRSDDQVADIRQQKSAAAEQQQKQQQLAAMAGPAKDGAQAAKALSEARAGGAGGSILDGINSAIAQQSATAQQAATA